MNKRTILSITIAGLLAVAVGACGSDDEGSGSAGSGSGEQLSGTIAVDGSSTVFPFAQAAAELFREEQPDVNVTVGESGTGGGFEKFCAGETDISNASRPIKDDEEVPLCDDAGVTFKELTVANDGISIVANPSLEVECLTVEQLSQLWKDDKVTDYADLGADGLSGEVSLYGPGTDSGTFDFSTDVINGEEGVSRKKYQPSEDDNVLVQGVSGDQSAMGYFGFTYYEENADSLKLVGVDNGEGCVAPSVETIQDGSYAPLSRPLFMYPSDQALERLEVKAFMDFIAENHATIAEAAAFVPLTDEQAAEVEGALAG
jgi:phosphate transport system substrate-binding protein